MKEKKLLGFELNEEDYENMVLIKPDFDIKKLFPEKSHLDYLKEFLLTKKNYQTAIDAVNDCQEKSLPDNIKENCKWCKGESEDELDKKCHRYYTQMNMTFTLASSEFIRIVLRHKHIYDNKKHLLQLTINFFNCLNFIKGKGLMYFDLDKMRRFVLSAGFLSLSEVFAKSNALTSLTIINNTLDSLKEEEVQNEVLQREDHNYLDLQIKFFEGKKGVYNTKVFIEKEEKEQGLLNEVERKNDNLYSALEWATIFYYADEAKLLPKAKTIKEKLKRFQKKHHIKTTFDNFKSKYYEAKRRINKKNDFPINKLEELIPFLKKNYKHAAVLADRDIEFLNSESSDY